MATHHIRGHVKNHLSQLMESVDLNIRRKCKRRRQILMILFQITGEEMEEYILKVLENRQPLLIIHGFDPTHRI